MRLSWTGQWGVTLPSSDGGGCHCQEFYWTLVPLVWQEYSGANPCTAQGSCASEDERNWACMQQSVFAASGCSCHGHGLLQPNLRRDRVLCQCMSALWCIQALIPFCWLLYPASARSFPWHGFLPFLWLVCNEKQNLKVGHIHSMQCQVSQRNL